MLSSFEMSLRLLLEVDRRRRAVEVTSSVAVAKVIIFSVQQMNNAAEINPANIVLVTLAISYNSLDKALMILLCGRLMQTD